MIHIYQGFCPDELQPDSRDPKCPACQVEAERNQLRAENARLTAELAAARERITRLENWVREEGDRSNTCTYDILNKEICNGCLCGRLTK